MSRGRGYLPDTLADVETDLRFRHVGALLGATPARTTDAIDYRALLERVPDQGGTSSCVGQAFATSIYLRAKLSGHLIPRPSAKAIYDVARLRDAAHQPLADVGSRPRAALEGLQDEGVVAESRWPLTDANVNELPPLDVFQHGLAAMVSGWYRIGAGIGSATLVRQAIAKGFFPVFAMNVSAWYEELGSDGMVDGLHGPSVGGHMQCVVGFGFGRLIVANSWSSAWGDGGFAYLSDAFFENAARDILVVTVVPTNVT